MLTLYKHVYADFDTVYCQDYTLVTSRKNALPVSYRDKEYVLYHYSPEMRKRIKQRILDNVQNITPAKGTTVHMIPGYGISLDEVRRNYSVSYTFNKADYNVLGDIDEMMFLRRGQYIYSQPVYIYTSKNLIVGIDVDKDSDEFISMFGYVYNEPMGPKHISLVMTKIPHNLYEACLYNRLQHPLIPENALNVESGNKLTDEILCTAAHAFIANGDKLAMENCRTQLSILNQYNWRDYPMTMFNLIYGIESNKSSIYWIRDAKHRESKAIQYMLKTVYDNFMNLNMNQISEQDYIMLQKMYALLNNLKEKTIINANSGKAYVSIPGAMGCNSFSSLCTDMYQFTIKVEAKSYEQFRKEKGL